MKIIGVNKQVISVLGMPHSGTTIVSNTLNSMENGFCLSEPLWTLVTKPFLLRFDKIGDIGLSNPRHVITKIRRKLNISEYDFGGVKETYRPKNEKMTDLYDIIVKQSDIILFVFREPKALLNNFKKTPGNHMPISRLLYIYNKLIDLSNTTQNSIKIILEDYCDSTDPIKYLNSRANGIFTVEGELELKATNFTYGDSNANKSTILKRANRDISKINNQEAKIIDTNLLTKYQDIRTNG